MNDEQKKHRDDFVNTKALQRFPEQWIDTAKNFKQEINAGRRSLSKEMLEIGYDAGFADAAKEIDKLKRKYAWLIRHAWMCAAISKAKAAELLGCSLIDFDEKISQALKELENG